MTIDTKTVASMTEANQDFSKVTRIVDQYGRAVVFKNNAPRYLIIDFNLIGNNESASTDDVMASSAAIMDRFDKSFEALAKYPGYQ